MKTIPHQNWLICSFQGSNSHDLHRKLFSGFKIPKRLPLGGEKFPSAAEVKTEIQEKCEILMNAVHNVIRHLASLIMVRNCIQ